MHQRIFSIHNNPLGYANVNIICFGGFVPNHSVVPLLSATIYHSKLYIIYSSSLTWCTHTHTHTHTHTFRTRNTRLTSVRMWLHSGLPPHISYNLSTCGFNTWTDRLTNPGVEIFKCFLNFGKFVLEPRVFFLDRRHVITGRCTYELFYVLHCVRWSHRLFV